MPSPFKCFLWILVMVTAFGVLVGTLNLWNPDLVYIPFGTDEAGNPQTAEGLDGMIAATASAGVLGIFFGLVAAFFAWIFRVGVNKTNNG